MMLTLSPRTAGTAPLTIDLAAFDAWLATGGARAVFRRRHPWLCPLAMYLRTHGPAPGRYEVGDRVLRELTSGAEWHLGALRRFTRAVDRRWDLAGIRACDARRILRAMQRACVEVSCA